LGLAIEDDAQDSSANSALSEPFPEQPRSGELSLDLNTLLHSNPGASSMDVDNVNEGDVVLALQAPLAQQDLNNMSVDDVNLNLGVADVNMHDLLPDDLMIDINAAPLSPQERNDHGQQTSLVNQNVKLHVGFMQNFDQDVTDPVFESFALQMGQQQMTLNR
jgi:hypothetical protein